jgi:hypothetical protein
MLRSRPLRLPPALLCGILGPNSSSNLGARFLFNLFVFNPLRTLLAHGATLTANLSITYALFSAPRGVPPPIPDYC